MFKKEYLILLAVIMAAGLYLYLKDRDRVNYRLPEVKTVEKTAIAGIEIRRPGQEAVTLEKIDGRWRIAAVGHPADEAQVNEMLEALSNLTLTALVSDAGDYDRYDLDEESAILVTARSGENAVVRDLTVGKRAASYQHTFVRVGRDPAVYHAGGRLHETFDKTADALRDKTVLAFDQEEIQRISIAMAGETLELERQPVPAAAPDARAADGEALPEGQQPVWKTSDGQSADPAGIEGLLGALSSLKCDGYRQEGTETDLTNPVYMITLTGQKTYTLSLFSLPDKTETGYAGLSSENKSAFNLAEFQAGRIMKKPSELLASDAQ
jgi:hypothetical protein